jgi:hypothetical protein
MCLYTVWVDRLGGDGLGFWMRDYGGRGGPGPRRVAAAALRLSSLAHCDAGECVLSLGVYF